MMAGHSVGTVFVELDLDASRYTKGQQKLLKDATSTTLNIEENFKKLGIRSSAEFDLMRAKAENAYTRIKNSAQATSNDIIRAEKAKNDQLTRLNEQQFGKQISFIESIKKHWLAYSAAAYGAMRLISSGWSLMEDAAKFEEQKKGIENLARSYGSSADAILSELRRVSGGTIDTMTLIEKAGTAMMMGIAPDKVTKLMEIARATARMTGQDVSKAFSDIALAVGRQSKMILDNLGIIVSVEKANETYAASLGKTASQLTDAEKKQAFMNATVLAGEELIARLGTQVDTDRDRMQRWTAVIADLRIELGKLLLVFTPLIQALADAAEGFNMLISSSEQAIMSRQRMAILEEINQLEQLSAKGASWWDKVKAGAMMGESGEMPENPLASQVYGTPAEWAQRKAELNRQLQELSIKMNAPKTSTPLPIPTGGGAAGSKEELDKSKKEYESFLKEVESMHASSIKTLGLEYPNQSEVLERELKKREKMEEDSADERMKEYKKIAEDEEEAWGLQTLTVKTETKKQSEYVLQAARNMQDAMSDFFFDALSGDLHDFGDYWKSFWNSMLKIFSNALAEMVLTWASSIFGGGGTGGGGLLSSLAGLFGGGGGTGGAGGGAGGGVLGTLGSGASAVGKWLGIGGGGAAAGAGLTAAGSTAAELAGGVAASGVGFGTGSGLGAGASAGTSGMGAGMAGMATTAIAMAPIAIAAGTLLYAATKPEMPDTLDTKWFENAYDPKWESGQGLSQGTWAKAFEGYSPLQHNPATWNDSWYGSALRYYLEGRNAIVNAINQQAYDYMINYNPPGGREAFERALQAQNWVMSDVGESGYFTKENWQQGVANQLMAMANEYSGILGTIIATGNPIARTNEFLYGAPEAAPAEENSLNTTGLWGYGTGGIVPQDQVAKVHKGEGIFTPSQMRALTPSGGGVTINSPIVSIGGNLIASKTDFDTFVKKIDEVLTKRNKRRFS